MDFLTFEADIKSEKSDKPGFCFVLVPKQISGAFSRRGRTSALIQVNNYSFEKILEPDGNLCHWFRLDENEIKEAKLHLKERAIFSIKPLPKELEPCVPLDLRKALNENHLANIAWDKTTTIARIDWVHWIETARQEKTRTKRINDAINMLEQGKLRVCCFDSSGFYSKAFRAPISATD